MSSPLDATFPLILPSNQCFSLLLLCPPTQAEVIIIRMGYYVVNKVFLPRVKQLLGDCGSARSWWTEVDLSRKAGHAHDSSSSETSASLVTHGNHHVNTHNFALTLKMFRAVRAPLFTGVGQWWCYRLMQFSLYICVGQTWGTEDFLVKNIYFFTLTAPVPSSMYTEICAKSLIKTRHTVHEEGRFHCQTPEGSAARVMRFFFKKREKEVGCRQNFPRSGEITNF